MKGYKNIDVSSPKKVLLDHSHRRSGHKNSFHPSFEGDAARQKHIRELLEKNAKKSGNNSL